MLLSSLKILLLFKVVVFVGIRYLKRNFMNNLAVRFTAVSY